ncbi:MAG: XrtV sorting system accessory protein [Pseudomonadota bacterium]
MDTLYDWLSLLAFAGLITLFLNRSAMDEPPDTIWHYMPPSLACAVANYVGNEGYGAAAIIIIVGVVLYVYFVLNPFRKPE